MYQFGVDVMFNGALIMHRARAIMHIYGLGLLCCPSWMHTHNGEGPSLVSIDAISSSCYDHMLTCAAAILQATCTAMSAPTRYGLKPYPPQRWFLAETEPCL